MGRKLLKTVQTITTFRNPLADPVGTRRGPPLVRGPQFENRWYRISHVHHSHLELIMGDRVERLLEVHKAHIEWVLVLACLTDYGPANIKNVAIDMINSLLTDI